MIVDWKSYPSVSAEGRNANAEKVKALGLPKHRGIGRLALVGGGPSINRHIEELRHWNGTIWAVNGAINWCLDRGIDAYFYTVDASPIEKWPYDLSMVRKAVLAPDCDPSLFACLKNADVSLTETPDGGPTSACAADLLSVLAGYSPMTWFGCESSFAETTHAFVSADLPEWIEIALGGQMFRTKLEFISQAKAIVGVIKAFPDFYFERSGGLLSAMLEHGEDYEVVDMSAALWRNCRQKVVEAA